ncbi:MAG: hypothetical protein IJZ25_02985 [Lachnospiraceae bacterium]|nr:hypothetical protein [Lachnospiraceae bacterium]
MTIKRNVKSIKKVITSSIALVLLISVCSACIWGVVSVAKNGIATSDTATWGIGTDGLATNGVATNGIATGGIGIATDGVTTEGNSTGYDIYAPLKNVLVATGEVTWEEINRKGYGGTLGDENRQDIFNRVLKEAIECGAFPAEKNSGTCVNKLKNAISGYYDYYGVDLGGNHDTLLLKNKIQNSLSGYKPVIGDFEAPNGDNHSMCICGYYDITVRYKTSSGASYSYKTYRYYRVNNGYENAYSRYDSQTARRLQYIYEEYLYSITRIV